MINQASTIDFPTLPKDEKSNQALLIFYPVMSSEEVRE